MEKCGQKHSGKPEVKPVISCNLCKDTGYIKYKDIEELTDYRWIPWSKKPCSCKEK